MTHPTRIALDEAIHNAQRGHRPHEWEDAALVLALAATQYVEHVEEKRREAPKSLQEMQEEVTSWCERKGWRGRGSAPVTFGDTMALLHSEVSEALEAYRDHRLMDATGTYNPSEHDAGCAYANPGDGYAMACTCSFKETAKPEGVGSEFADVLIRLLDDCGRWGVDLAFEYERKMAYNEKRPFQHGGRTL
jgi:NTP pyrophosphatase (non-canonical NTP hydrolase)